MKTILAISVIAMITITSCTKEVTGATASSGPTLTFKSYSILTIGDSIKNATSILPFTLPTQNYLAYLNPNISAVQCDVEWHQISETGQPIEMGSTAQTTPDIASIIQTYSYNNCTLLQYQNKETDHYTDGSSQDILVGPQYYAIVKVVQ